MPTHLKQPLGRSQNIFAEKKIADAMQLVGKCLPCSVLSVSGSIVQVKFEVVTTFTLPTIRVPVANSIYCRLPIQRGDQGVVRPADVYVGGVSGLGGGTANLSQRANLSTLVFEPVGNAGWPAVNPNQLYLQGPGGVIVQNMSGSAATIDLTPGSISLSAGGHTVVISNAGVVIDGRPFLTHEHMGVQTGTSNTEGVA